MGRRPIRIFTGEFFCVAKLWQEHGMIRLGESCPLDPLDGASMLVTLVALLCNGEVCLEKIVTNSDLSSITMMECQVHAQAGIAEWLQNGPYRSWKLQGYKCVIGKYTPKHQA